MKYYYLYDLSYREIISASSPLTTHLQDFQNSSIKDFLEHPHSFWPDWSGKKVLVIGSGLGQLCEYFFEKGCLVTGIDISSAAIEFSKSRAKDSKRQKYFVMDATEFELGETFDAIIDNHCLHCLVFPEERQGHFTKVAKHLNPSSPYILESMVHSNAVRFSDNLSFDENKILWRTSGKGENCAFPLRKLSTAYELEQEILQRLFQIQYFVYFGNLKVEIGENIGIPSHHWPGVMRIVALAPA